MILSRSKGERRKGRECVETDQPCVIFLSLSSLKKKLQERKEADLEER